jgi:hypothetical protein
MKKSELVLTAAFFFVSGLRWWYSPQLSVAILYARTNTVGVQLTWRREGEVREGGGRERERERDREEGGRERERERGGSPSSLNTHTHSIIL